MSLPDYTQIHPEGPTDDRDDPTIWRGILLPEGDGGHDLGEVGVFVDTHDIRVVAISYGIGFRFRDGRALDWWPHTGSQVWRNPRKEWRARCGDALATLRYAIHKALRDKLVAERPQFQLSQAGYYASKDYDARIAHEDVAMETIRYGAFSEEAEKARRKLASAQYVGD